MKLSNKNIFDVCIWASDYQEFTGEGLLARCFVDKFFFNSNLRIKIYSHFGEYFYYDNKVTLLKKKEKSISIFSKYLSPFYGVLLLWYQFLKGKRTCYVNYLPLWNFLIFFLLPKKTILGPITGSIYKKKVVNLESVIRKYLFIIFYKISINIIFNKFNHIIFSTDNLESLIDSKNKKKCLFNFCFLFYNKRSRQRKSIDIVFYIRNHSQKSNKIQFSLIKKIASLKYKVVIAGEKVSYPGIKNYLNIKRDDLLKILDRTKFAFASDENFYSLFTLDCLSSNVLVFFNNRLFNKKKSQLIPINYEKELSEDSNRGRIIKEIDSFLIKKRDYNFDFFIEMKKIKINKKLSIIINSYLR